jgi:ribosomal protein S19E (S16A)
VVALRSSGELQPMLTMKSQAWGEELLARRQDAVLLRRIYITGCFCLSRTWNAYGVKTYPGKKTYD